MPCTDGINDALSQALNSDDPDEALALLAASLDALLNTLSERGGLASEETRHQLDLAASVAFRVLADFDLDTDELDEVSRSLVVLGGVAQDVSSVVVDKQCSQLIDCCSPAG